MFSGKRRAVPGSTTTAAAAPAPPSPTKRPVTTTTTTTTTTTKKLIRRAIAPLPTDPNRPKSVNKYVPPPRIPAPSAPPEDRRPAKRARPSASSSSPASFRRPSPAAATAAVFNRGDPSSDLDPLTPSEAEEEGGDAEADSDLSSADEDYSSRTIRREDGAAVAVRNVAAPIPASDDGRIRVTSAESLVLQNPTAYRPYFTDPADPQKPASDWAGSDIPTVELQYPGEGGSERFALLAPRSDDEYNPIEDVMSVILTVLDHFLTPDQASQYFGHAPGKTAFSAFLYNRASPSTGGGGGGSGGGSGRNSRAGTPLVPPPTALRPAAAVAAAARGRSPALPARADSPAQLELSASSTKTGPPEAVASVDPIADGDAAAAHSVRGDAHVPESKTAADPQAGAPTPAPPPLPPPTPHLPYHHHHQQQQQHQQHQHPQGGESLIRQLEKARSKSDGPAFLAALERYNATLSALKRDGTVRAHVEGMRGLRERVWTRVFTQCYDRAVGPGLDAVKKYRAFSDNVYGELLPKFMNEIFARTHLGPNSVFVDLGSGVGNCVVQAALATGAESWGFENMPHASQLARAQVVEAEQRFKLWGLSGGAMHVREADFCESPEVGAVLRRADVVLVNNEVFTSTLNERLSWLFLELPPSAKIVSLKPFLAPSFKLSSHNVHSPLAILAQYPPLRYTSNCVSWKPEGGTYFLARIDRGRVERFQDKERERERRREGEKRERRDRREGSAASAATTRGSASMSRTGSAYSSSAIGGGGTGMSRTPSRQGGSSHLAK